MKRDDLIVISIVIIIVWFMMRKPVQTGIDMAKKALSRGYRNNNPGNIVLTFDGKGNKSYWQGEVDGSDSRFKTFRDMNHGYRAIFVTLNSYIKKGYDTIEKIINRYAPPHENETTSYARTVSRMTGIAPDQPVTFNRPQDIIAIAEAISYVENGIKANPDDVIEGYKLFKNV
jgi:hypothetical protein